MNRAGATKLLPSPSTHSEALTSVTSQQEEQRVDRIYRETMAEQWDLYAAQQLLIQESEAEMQFGARHRSTNTNLDNDGLDADTDDEHSIRAGLTMGYVTRDRCPGKGDDIEHVPGELLRSPQSGQRADGSAILLRAVVSPSPSTSALRCFALPLPKSALVGACSPQFIWRHGAAVPFKSGANSPGTDQQRLFLLAIPS
jgi:hypothetical protein